jgi:hypothetical protein
VSSILKFSSLVGHYRYSNMDNILDLLIKNKEWLFSGIGIVLILGLFSIIRKLIYRQKKESIPLSGPQNLKVIFESPPSPAIIETKSAPYSTPANIVPLESLSPSEIFRTIREAPLLQQDEITKHYIGLKVTWEGKLSSASTKENDIVRMYMYSLYDPIVFEVNKNDYPGLGLLKKDTIITIEGIIDKIEGYFTIKDARIISVTSHDANSLPK